MSRKTLLITGASAGIGAACARLAAERGYDLYVNYNSDAGGAEATAETARAAGAQATVIQADVSDASAISAMFEQIPRLDGLINNAGIMGQTARLTDMDHARLRQMFDVNVIGAMLVAKEAVLRMDKGVIVNVSSAAARLGSGNQYLDYAASKAAIDTFTKGLSDEVAAQGIRVVSVRPGIIDTDIHAKGGEPDRADRLAPMVPMKRKGSAEEVAEVILWLMSDQASYVTGTAIDVTGGR